MCVQIAHGKTKYSGLNKWQQLFHISSWPSIYSCIQFSFFTLVPKYLNFATFSQDLLFILMLCMDNYHIIIYLDSLFPKPETNMKYFLWKHNTPKVNYTPFWISWGGSRVSIGNIMW